jgi:hypothetical protein
MAKTQKVIQSFNSGELSPKMDSRIDQQKYLSGCRTLENFIPLIYGGAERRPGLEYIAGCKSNSSKSRLIAFEHSVNDTYILEFANQVIRVYRNGAQVVDGAGTEDLSALSGNLIAHWKLNDNAANTAVDDAVASIPHDGVASSNTEDIRATGKVGTGCIDFAGANSIIVSDHNELSYGNGTVDSPFSVAAWVNITSFAGDGVILAKYDTNSKREWQLRLNSNKIRFYLADQSVSKYPYKESDAALENGWRFIVATYTGQSTAGATAANLITLYVDGAAVAGTSTNEATYDAMENLTGDLSIGCRLATGAAAGIYGDKIDNVALFDKELSAAEISALYSSSAYEISTPYLTADLFALKHTQSADVMYITHPDYEPRKLSRTGHTAWTLEVLDLQTGPFRDENATLSKTIACSARTGTGITLTAVGHAPFVAHTTAGHVPNGSSATDKSQTGALFKIVHAETDNSVDGDLDDDPTETSELTVYKGVTWDFTTNGTWTGTVDLQREYNNSGVWENVHTVVSVANKNATTSGTEENADAQYKVVFSTRVSGQAEVQLSVRDTAHIGIVEITAVASGTSATANVIKTIASTNATHRWSEGSFSNYRGWPVSCTISPEERLTFAGNTSEPLTTWGSVVGDWTDFKEGVLDDDAIQFALIGLGQQNQIQWSLSKNTLILGTVGGEHLLGSSNDEEALTPSNVKAKIQTTYGSENIAANIVNQAVIFVQRGGKKVREFLYNFEADAHKADDLTVFSDHITESGLVDITFQRSPDPTLLGVRTDGEMANMTYERDQDVFSWYRVVTGTNAGTSSAFNASVIESVAVIYGGSNSEDEVWVTVNRTINSSTVRYVERFTTRAVASSMSDMKYLDSYITYTGATTTATGLSHLVGESVQVLTDGVQATEATAGDFTVNGSGQITLPASGTTVQIGLGYTSTLKPMKLDIANLGLGTTKKISRAILNLYNTIGGEVGTTTSNVQSISTLTGTAALFAGEVEVPMPGGYSRTGDIIVRQTGPLPMTVLSLTLDVGASND